MVWNPGKGWPGSSLTGPPGPHSRPREHSHLKTPRHRVFQEPHWTAGETEAQGSNRSHLSSLCCPVSSYCHLSFMPSPSAIGLWLQASQGWTSWVTLGPSLPSLGLSHPSPQSGRESPRAQCNTSGLGSLGSGFLFPHTCRTASLTSSWTLQNHTQKPGWMLGSPSFPPAETCSITLLNNLGRSYYWPHSTEEGTEVWGGPVAIQGWGERELLGWLPGGRELASEGSI